MGRRSWAGLPDLSWRAGLGCDPCCSVPLKAQASEAGRDGAAVAGGPPYGRPMLSLDEVGVVGVPAAGPAVEALDREEDRAQSDSLGACSLRPEVSQVQLGIRHTARMAAAVTMRGAANSGVRSVAASTMRVDQRCH